MKGYRIVVINKCTECPNGQCPKRVMCGAIPNECPLDTPLEFDVKRYEFLQGIPSKNE